MYPLYEPNVTFGSMLSTGNKASMRMPMVMYANTMSLTAVADDIEIQDGDKLIALSESEVRGEAILAKGSDLEQTSQLFYMSIQGDSDAPLSFAIERDGRIIATTGNVMEYHVNDVSGNANEPIHISFINIDLTQDDDVWYTLQGIRLQEKPVKEGLYIHNGRKEYIK